MVEALSTSFQNLYNKYTRSENPEILPRTDRREIYIVPINAAGDDQEQQHLFQRYRPKYRKTFVFSTKQLCEAKDSKWQIMRQKKLRPFVGPCCSVCIPVRVSCGTCLFIFFIDLRCIYINRRRHFPAHGEERQMCHVKSEKLIGHLQHRPPGKVHVRLFR